ncbi:MAG: nodulation protein NfeD, partial [Deltaproteobacteria bacterium]|nr:nodulation protein NfeD [Deltaproteobacteria bacterium]
WQSLLAVVAVLAVGVVLIAIEVFVTPGFGVGGVMGMVLLLGGSVGAWLVLGPTWGSLVVVLTVALATVMVIFGLRSKAAKKRLVLSTEQPHGGGVETSDLAYLIGSEGTAKTDLRPAGIATIGDERIDVVSEGGFIDQQTTIKVVAVDGPRVIVARIE